MGAAALRAALDEKQPLRFVLARPGSLPAGTRADLERAGIPVLRATLNDLRRMSRVEPTADVLALVGADPAAPSAEVLAGRGSAWLLVDVAYPGNAGFAIRTAEVSGADGIFLDARLDAAARKQALRASMHAERFLPVRWEPAASVIRAARAAGRRILAVEDSGTHAPWERDLTGSLLFVIGGERRGIPAEILGACDHVLRLPVAGFIPSYNLQAAMAAVAAERLRQLEGSGARGG